MSKVWKEVTASEMRISLIDNLNRYKVGFNDVESFNLGLLYNAKTVDKDRLGKGTNRDIVKAAMEYKRRDELIHRKRMIRKKILMRKKAKESLGEKTNKYKRLMSHLNEEAKMMRKELNTKYEKKINHLKMKYMEDKQAEMDVVPDEMKEFGGAAVFDREKFDEIEADEIKVVKYGDVETTQDEDAVLKLHPKMAIARRLPEGYMAVNQDIGYTKIRWQLRKEEEDEEQILEKRMRKEKESDEEKRIRMMREEHNEMEEARTRQVYDPEDKSYDERKMRVTDMQECTRIHLPKPLGIKREAEIELHREAHKKVSEGYRKEKCDDKDNQEDILTKQERRGLKSLEKRKKDGEIIITMTDKSSKLCIMKREDYLRLGEDHVSKDLEVDRREVQRREKSEVIKPTFNKLVQNLENWRGT